MIGYTLSVCLSQTTLLVQETLISISCLGFEVSLRFDYFQTKCA